jgi:hypothetical protein
MAAVESVDGPEDEEDPEENRPILLKRSRTDAPEPDPTDSDDSDVETRKLVAENGVLSDTEDEEDDEEDDEDVPLLARRMPKRSCRRTTLPPSPSPKLSWICADCTYENEKMMASVCEMCKGPRFWACAKCTADNAAMEASLCNTCSAPRVPLAPSPTWKCAQCTYENRNMLANVCEVCQEARNKAVAARMRVIARAWDAK